ncbi:MAG TPA: DNA recombination protein RmuC [Acidimicrobiales bacterium]|jgi:DNA recombination protein RmuC|nr:DNA recombination protein RmuC [Acidimicrobiales bacterium]
MIGGLIVGLAAGAALGVVIGLLLRSGQLASARTAEARLDDANGAISRLTAEIAGLQLQLATGQAETVRLTTELGHQRRTAEERAASFDETRQQLTGEFARLSTAALQKNNEQFLQLADTKLKETREAAEGELAKRQVAIEQLLKPIGEQLGKYDEGMQRLEVERQGAYTTLTEQMKYLSTSHDQLQKETGNLVKALRAPQSRGQWGELQLRRVVEMAGMLEHCDFDEQVTSDADDGGRMRPDMVVHSPGGMNVAVDAKVPMQAWLDANDADDETVRRAHLARHGRQLRAHIDQLAKKEYWKRVDPSPEYVVAFIPGDPLLTAALEHEPGLMEHAAANNVLLATPTSLIALLRSAAYGWQQDTLAQNAREVQQLGTELYQRLSVLGDHVAGVGKGLNNAVVAYNKAVGSLETRVLVTARRFVEMGVGGGEKDLPEPASIDAVTRALQAPELVPPAIEVPYVHGLRVAEAELPAGQDDQLYSPDRAVN